MGMVANLVKGQYLNKFNRRLHMKSFNRRLHKKSDEKWPRYFNGEVVLKFYYYLHAEAQVFLGLKLLTVSGGFDT